MQPYPIHSSDSFEALLGSVKAGFPSPADDFREKLDLVKLLVRHSASTFFFRIDGVSMVDADMDEGDIIIVDRAVEPYSGCKAVCFIDGEYTVKRVELREGGAVLLPCNEHNSKYRPIPVGPDNDKWLLSETAKADRVFCCWGTHAKLGGRQTHLLELLKDRPLYYLRLTSGGFPSHPLYLPGDLEPVRWRA